MQTNLIDLMETRGEEGIRLVSAGEASNVLGVCARTLRTWAKNGKISSIRTEGGQFRYNVVEYISRKSIPPTGV